MENINSNTKSVNWIPSIALGSLLIACYLLNIIKLAFENKDGSKVSEFLSKWLLVSKTVPSELVGIVNITYFFLLLWIWLATIGFAYFMLKLPRYMLDTIDSIGELFKNK